MPGINDDMHYLTEYTLSVFFYILLLLSNLYCAIFKFSEGICQNNRADTVDLVIFARFEFSQIPRRGQIREFKNHAKIIIIIELLKENENSSNSKLLGKP